ncbi:Extracellular serine-rich protein-like protein 4 [Stagonosporopsis vannaccii]|nr:Extracellular serine-rich protein-like protein 4 [Stagonosporopsis vannaccii]
MYFSKSFIVSALVGFTTAQSSASTQSIAASETLSSTANSTASAPTTSSTLAASGGSLVTHTIQVGGPNGSLAFYPNNIQANAGDMVQFQFHPKNHSVVQSTFDNPCVPIQNIMANKTNAFFSGFMPTAASANSSSQLLTYTIRVPDDKPIWFYCSQGKHCQAGMVGAINAYAHVFHTNSAVINTNAYTVLPLAKRQCNPSPQNLSPGQGAGSGTTGGNGSGTTSPSGSGSSGSPTLGSGASGTTGSPAQNTANAAPALDTQSLFSFGAAALAAYALWC